MTTRRYVFACLGAGYGTQVTFPCQLYPVADKVCATMDTQYPGSKRSTRVKDLVDLVLIACTQTVDLCELRVDLCGASSCRTSRI